MLGLFSGHVLACFLPSQLLFYLVSGYVLTVLSLPQTGEITKWSPRRYLAGEHQYNPA